MTLSPTHERGPGPRRAHRKPDGSIPGERRSLRRLVACTAALAATASVPALAFDCRPAKMGPIGPETGSAPAAGGRRTGMEARVEVGNEAVSENAMTSCAETLFMRHLAGAVVQMPAADTAIVTFVGEAGPGRRAASKFTVLFKKTDGLWRMR